MDHALHKGPLYIVATENAGIRATLEDNPSGLGPDDLVDGGSSSSEKIRLRALAMKKKREEADCAARAQRSTRADGEEAGAEAERVCLAAVAAASE